MYRLYTKNDPPEPGEQLVHHDFTEDHSEMFLPAVDDSCGHHVHKAPLDGLRTVEVETRVEERRVGAGDDPAHGLARQPRAVQLGLVRHVHAELVQVVDVVRVGGDLVLAGPLPGEDDHTVHLLLLTQVHHPHRLRERYNNQKYILLCKATGEQSPVLYCYSQSHRNSLIL